MNIVQEFVEKDSVNCTILVSPDIMLHILMHELVVGYCDWVVFNHIFQDIVRSIVLYICDGIPN